MRQLLSLLFQRIAPAHECTVIFQTHEDAKMFANVRRWWPGPTRALKTAYFSDVEKWRSECGRHDLVVGSRIHGTMMGVAAGTPAFLVATDLRQTELADAMLVPKISVAELFANASARVENATLGHLVRGARFDGAAFDANRRAKVASYRRIVRAAGLELDPALDEYFPDSDAPGAR